MIDPATGVLLIAEPFMKDPNFLRTVVLLCSHDERGSMGFVINRKQEFTLDQLMNDANGLRLPVYYGGPVRLDTIHFLHHRPDLIPDSQRIKGDVCWGGDYEKAIELLRDGVLAEDHIRFFIGHSGWSHGQLAEEMAQHAWLTADATPDILFEKNEQEIWANALRLLGEAYAQVVHYPIDPQLN